MRILIRRYKELSFEQKIIFHTVIGLCFSTFLACGKLITGFFTDYNLCSIAIYTFVLLFSKFECLLGIKSAKRSFKWRNRIVAGLLFLSSVLYVGFMCRMFFIERRLKTGALSGVLALAFISFAELGSSIAGLLSIKNKDYLYQNIKIINFCIALIAILTTQMSILNMHSETGLVHIANAYTGIGIGCFIALCSIYILIAPKIGVTGKEHNIFLLQSEEKNGLVDMGKDTVEISLCRSFIYGSYVYRVKIEGRQIDGNIERDKSLWKRMPLWSKIICYVLSEILIFVWLIGRLIFFLRSINLPKRLEYKMNKNGFAKVGEISELSQSTEEL